MKSEEIQRFSSVDFIAVVFGLVVIVGISAPIIKRNFQTNDGVQVAQREISRLGDTLLNPKTLNLMAQGSAKENGRSIASIDEKSGEVVVDMSVIQKHLKNGEWGGDVGKDPWGRPYHFSFLKNVDGMHTHVAIWSDGPNQKSETSAIGSMTTTSGLDSSVFKGDDIGFIRPVR